MGCNKTYVTNMMWLCNLVLLLHRNIFGAVNVRFCVYLPIFIITFRKKKKAKTKTNTSKYLHLGSPVSLHYLIYEALTEMIRQRC